MKERSIRAISRRLRRIEELLNPAPISNIMTPEMQEFYERITGRSKPWETPPEKTGTASKG